MLALFCGLAPIPTAFARGQDSTAGVFDYYILALSWSPAYCELKPDDRSQCGHRRYAFIVHGLWPQYRAGGYPERCAAPPPPRAVVHRALAFMPSEALIRHEWRRHGGCSGLSPRDYFLATEQAFSAVNIPSLFRAEPIPQHLTAQAIVRAFVASNPGLTPQRVALQCRGPELEEVRICLSRSDLSPVDCGRGVKTHCRRGPIQIRPVR